ncbi:peptidylprolyl isomerase [Rhodosalinus sp. K401]|uniref:peptidylprolyl isomerase n=1 Tax=Rhodosalinus sp. K401 TaxID=3239195 RepID=UPI00352568E5
MIAPIRSLAATLALAVALPATAQDTAATPDADTVVATVNGQEITLGHMVVARTSLPQQYRQLPDDVLFEGILDQMIQQTLLAQQTGDTLSTRARVALENERRLLRAGDAVETIIGEVVTDEALRAAYEARFADADLGTEYNASHILVETEEEARDLVRQLEQGVDFGELAMAHSTGPSGPSGGELGWFGPGMMVPPFEEAVMAMEVGAVSEPVETQFGWHVITLNDTRSQAAPPLDEVREELAEEIRQAAVTERLEALRAEAEITMPDEGAMDPSALSDTSMLEN